MSDLKTRTLIFATFFGSLLAVGLLLVSLTTNHWVRSSAKIANFPESNGEVYYGLFSGTKELNVKIGTRVHSVNMLAFIEKEQDVMSFWLWLFTALGVGFALLSSAVAAIMSIIKAASSAKKGTMIILFLSNISSAMGQILAFVCWAVQFYQHLIHNVLAAEDTIDNKWYTKGLAYLGYSFWLVVLSTVIVIGNLIILYIAYKHDRSFKRYVEPVNEDKNQTAIMLY